MPQAAKERKIEKVGVGMADLSKFLPAKENKIIKKPSH